MKTTIISILCLILISATACEKSKTSASSEETSEHSESGHAEHGFEPGTHEDWCGEHQVPESLCTRCNQSLVAGFKATGDWCEKHQLPESQCLACNPDLKIERPPKKETK